MATESIFLVPSSNLNMFDRTELSPESATKVSEILQENHDTHHVLFNQRGMHNHIVHHITTLYALGAPPPLLEKHYTRNKTYQRPSHLSPTTLIISPSSLQNDDIFLQHMSDHDQYPAFLEFFTQEFRSHPQGWEGVVNRYLFGGDRVADQMLQQFVTFHPLIHLSCALELAQPALIAEALSLAAVQSRRLGDFLLEAEKAAAEFKKPKDKSLAALLGEAKNDERIQEVNVWEEEDRVKYGLLAKAKSEVLEYVGWWNVDPNEVEEKVAELANVAAFGAAAAQRPPKIVKLDFFLIHGVTTSHALTVLLQQPWIPLPAKVRLLEWVGRLEIAIYLLLGAPALFIDEIRNYIPKKPSYGGGDPWKNLIERALLVEDDGHCIKTIRALMHGQRMCAPFEHKPAFLVKGDMWLKIGHMCIDSMEFAAENGLVRWVRFCGFPEAWEEFPDRS